MTDIVLLNVRETARLLGVTIGTIYLWTNMGYLPGIKMGRVIRFRQSAILEWIKQKEHESLSYNVTPDGTAQERMGE